METKQMKTQEEKIKEIVLKHYPFEFIAPRELNSLCWDLDDLITSELNRRMEEVASRLTVYDIALETNEEVVTEMVKVSDLKSLLKEK